MTLFGVDLSDYDRGRGPVDVADMARDGIQMLTHKATEGTTRRHKYTGQTLAAARAAGIPYLGVYAVPRTPGNGGNGTVAQQVAYLMAYVDSAVPWWREHDRWFFQVDLEHWSNSSGPYDEVSPAVGVEMVRLIRQATGRPVVLYAPRWAYQDSIPGDAPLWASAYGDNEVLPYRHAYAVAGGDDSRRWARYSGRVPLVLQFGSRCRIGSQPDCDANAIRDEQSWRNLFPAAKTATPKGPDMLLVKVKNLPEVYVTDGQQYRHLASAQNLQALRAGGVPLVEVAAVEDLADVAGRPAADPAPPVDTAVLATQVADLLRPTQATAEQIALALVRQLLPTQQQPPAGAAPQS